jgi:hypothetical protein
MKKPILVTLFLLTVPALYSQETSDPGKLKDLAVPSSPAFILMDISPSLIQTPTAPKTFILGVTQAFQESNNGFPQNYSAEFAPYWWFNSSNKNAYTLLGIKTMFSEKNGTTPLPQENIFSGLKFTTISLAFLNKDVIPDSISSSQKVVGVGARTTLIKIHLKSYARSLVDSIAAWHALKQKFFDDQGLLIMQIMKETDPAKKAALQNQLNTTPSPRSDDILKFVNEMVSQKPVFAWDIAAAYAVYGIGDTAWKTGRYGIWTTVSSFLPLDIGGKKPCRNYFNLNFIFRYVVDNYAMDNNMVTTNRNMDFGAKAELIFNALTIGVEAEYRYLNFTPDYQNRTVGIINYRITDNLYINGAFGKNFTTPDKLIALFGINWGFGAEKINLPE